MLLVGAAYVVKSETVDPQRKELLSLIHRHVAPLSATGRVEEIECFEPDDVARLLTVQQQQPIVDVNPANMEDEAMRHAMKSLHVRQLSNSLKHVLALRKAGALLGGSQRFALILEDDAAFGNTMVEAVTRAVRDAPADADLVFLGQPSSRQCEPGVQSPALFDEPLEVFKNHVFPCCESYLVTPEAAARIAAAYMPIRFPTACQLTYLARKGVFRPYAVVPNAFVDASKLGVTTSMLEANNQLLWNQTYCRADLMLSAPGSYDPKQYDELWRQQPFKDHPDALVMHARHLERRGDFKGAMDAYARALEGFEKDGCIVNSTSQWLKSYMALFARAQDDVA